MDREALDAMSTEELQAEASKVRIPLANLRRNSHLRERLIDALTEYYEKNAPGDVLSGNPPITNTRASGYTSDSNMQRTAELVTEMQRPAVFEPQRSSDMSSDFLRPTGQPMTAGSSSDALSALLTQFCVSMTAQMNQNQQTLEKLLVAVTRNEEVTACPSRSDGSVRSTAEECGRPRSLSRSVAGFGFICSGGQPIDLADSTVQ